MSDADATRLVWLGWSGFLVTGPGGAALYIDPPAGTTFPADRAAHILITHGHPEHVEGTRAHLRNPARTQPVEVAAGAGVCRHLRRHARHPADRLRVCAPQEHFELAGFGVDVFSWHHMPLLPPGLGPKLAHLRALASRPGRALRIVLDGIRGPWPFPMLGFRIVPPGGERILVYGEGLHRMASADVVAAVGRELPADVLLAAVEPEDVDSLPELIARAGARQVALYEAHRPWREGFGMPLADLDALAAVLVRAGRRIRVFRQASTEAVLVA